MVLPGNRLHALQPCRGDEGEGGLEDCAGRSGERPAREDVPGEECDAFSSDTYYMYIYVMDKYQPMAAKTR